MDLFGPSLRAFSFSFTSLSSSQQHSVGELHVDLTKQMLFMKSTASNASLGMDAVTSTTLLRGDRKIMFTSLDLDGGLDGGLDGYSQCFKLDTSAMLPGASIYGGAVFQPFAGAMMSGVTTAGDPPVSAERHLLSIASMKLELFVDPSGNLVAVHFHDIEDKRQAKLLVRNFRASSSELARSIFEVKPEWEKCPAGGDHIDLRQWDLLRVFLTGPTGAPQTGGTTSSGDDGMATELPR